MGQEAFYFILVGKMRVEMFFTIYLYNYVYFVLKFNLSMGERVLAGHIGGIGDHRGGLAAHFAHISHARSAFYFMFVRVKYLGSLGNLGYFIV